MAIIAELFIILVSLSSWDLKFPKIFLDLNLKSAVTTREKSLAIFLVNTIFLN